MLSRWYVTDPDRRSLSADCQRSNRRKALKSSKFQCEQYCQNGKICGGKTERLVTCRSSEVGVSIQDTVDVSGNERWKVNFAHIIIDADFLSRDIHITNVAILVTVSLPRSCTTCWGVSTISITATSTTARPQHHKLSQSIIARKEHSIVQWKSVLAFCNLFQTEVGSERMDRKGSMFKIMSK